MRRGTHVRISREWHKPKIRIEITDTEIGISMPINDFMRALSAEIGRPIGILTKAQLLEKLEAAADRIVLSMKHETTAVVKPG